VAALVALRPSSRAGSVLVRALGVAAASLTVVYVAILTVDMGYYLYSGQRLDAVFMEYVADLFGQGRQGEIRGSQVAAQTAAELGEVGTWAVRVVSYAGLLIAAILVWRILFRRALAPVLRGWPRATAVALSVAVAVGAAAERPVAVHRGARPALPGPHHRGPSRDAVPRCDLRRQRDLRALPYERRADLPRALRLALLLPAASGHRGHQGALRERLSLPAHAARARRLSHADGDRPESRPESLAARALHGAQRPRGADRRERVSAEHAACGARRGRRRALRPHPRGDRRAAGRRAAVFPDDAHHRHSPPVRGADDPSGRGRAARRARSLRCGAALPRHRAGTLLPRARARGGPARHRRA